MRRLGVSLVDIESQITGTSVPLSINTEFEKHQQAMFETL